MESGKFDIGCSVLGREINRLDWIGLGENRVKEVWCWGLDVFFEVKL